MVLALAWNMGTCRPDRTIGQWRLRGSAVGRARERSKQRELRGAECRCGARGGPSRSSGEGPVMGLERRGRVVRACLAVNRFWVGGAG